MKAMRVRGKALRELSEASYRFTGGCGEGFEESTSAEALVEKLQQDLAAVTREEKVSSVTRPNRFL